LPPVEVEKLDELNELIVRCLPFAIKSDRLALALENANYIKKLLNLFHTCEETHNVKALHKLHEIFKNVFLLNKNPLFEAMLGEETLFDVIGVFEYDPSQAQPKRHREYLKSVSRFKEVIPFGNAELINKIHLTYRVQYIQDIVLPTPSVFEENMLSTLSSFIFFNKVEIVSLIQEDDKFLRELFAQVTDESTDDERRKDLVLFLKEFCTFSQTLQPQNRENFFKALSTLGVLQTLEVTLAMEDPVIRPASVDILTYVVEYSPSMVREYALHQAEKFDEVSCHLIGQNKKNDSFIYLFFNFLLSFTFRISI
jgi:PREDICTED: similar to falafel CG9351-PA, isoform A